MPRYTAGTRTTGAGSTTLPIASLMAIASRSCYVREIGIFNTTVTAVSLKIARLTAAGTVGAAIGVDKYHPTDDAAAMTPFNTHTVGPSIATSNLRIVPVGAAVGAGAIFTFAEPGLYIPAGTANGIAIVPAVGTGQVCDVYFEWEE